MISSGQRVGAKLYSQLSFLFDAVKEGDGPPTQGMTQVYAELAAELGKLGRRIPIADDRRPGQAERQGQGTGPAHRHRPARTAGGCGGRRH